MNFSLIIMNGLFKLKLRRPHKEYCHMHSVTYAISIIACPLLTMLTDRHINQLQLQAPGEPSAWRSDQMHAQIEIAPAPGVTTSPQTLPSSTRTQPR